MKRVHDVLAREGTPFTSVPPLGTHFCFLPSAACAPT